MSRLAAFAGVLVLSLGIVPSAQAGLYNTADSDKELMLSWDWNVFNFVLGDLRSIGAGNPDRQSTLRKRYMLMETLGNKGAFDLRTLEQQLDYSVVLIRRGKADEAIVLLTPLTRENPRNIILHSHFATAHFLSANPMDRAKASGLMFDCLRIWPNTWDELDKEQQEDLKRMGWGQGLFEQNRKYEEYLHKLMQLRRKPAPGITLDPLFGPKDQPLRFVGEKGKYEAGRLAQAEKAKLPGDAIEIVEQLLVWMPNDLQLFWLLGEVFNASALSKKDEQSRYQDIKAAHSIMREIVTGNGMRKQDIPKDLTDHYEVLTDYLQKNKAPNPQNEALTGILNEFKNKKTDEIDPTPTETSYRQLIVAFLVGLAIGMFAVWQIQEMRRRRQARTN